MKNFALILSCILVLYSLPVFAGDETVIFKDTVWRGEVQVSEDVLVLPGVTLTVEAGTSIIVSPYYESINMLVTLQAFGNICSIQLKRM